MLIKVKAQTEEKAYNNIVTEVMKEVKNAYSHERYRRKNGIDYVFILDDDNNILADLEIMIQQPKDGGYSAKTKIAV